MDTFSPPASLSGDLTSGHGTRISSKTKTVQRKLLFFVTNVDNGFAKRTILHYEK